MRTRGSLWLVLFFCFLPPSVSANPYVVHLGQAKATVEESLAPYRPLGLVSLGKLESLSGVVMVEMPPAVARIMEGQGFEIESFPERHLRQEEPPVPWNLDRENQRALPLDGNTVRSSTGKGVRIFILDTEIFRNPDEFGDRLVDPGDYAHDGKGAFADCGSPASHATAVASIAAGNIYGVAPGAEISPKRIFNCQGGMWGPDYYKALDDIATWKKVHPASRAVVNMSYGGPGWKPTEHKLLQALDRLGVLLVAAAPEDQSDPCSDAPSGYPEVVSVSASTKDDRKASWAAGGSCVQLFAPGDDIHMRSGPGTQEWGGIGTSFSSPAAAGAEALIAEQKPALTPVELRKLLLANATTGALQGDLGKGSPNRLLYTGPVKEEISRLTFQWNAGKRQFTVQVALSLNGKPSPLSPVRLYRGAAVGGACQGESFATVPLVNGSGTVTVKGFKLAPRVVCLETRSGLVYDRAVGNL